MKTRMHKMALAGIAAALLLGACTTVGPRPEVTAVRSKLTALQSDPQLAARAPHEIADAEEEVAFLESKQNNPDYDYAGMVYLADRKVDTARAAASAKLAEEQVAIARTRESQLSRSDADAQRLAAQNAQQQAQLAMMEAQDYKNRLAELKAMQTDRGMVMSLTSDLLFSFNKADLKPGAQTRLDQLAVFMKNYPDQSITIEGHTDNVGSDDYNLMLSQRRAESVKSYLTARGVPSGRVQAVGRGESLPVTGNEEDAARQQNRRVDIIFQNLSPAPRG